MQAEPLHGSSSQAEGPQGPFSSPAALNSLSEQGLSPLHLVAGLGYDWACTSLINMGASVHLQVCNLLLHMSLHVRVYVTPHVMDCRSSVLLTACCAATCHCNASLHPATAALLSADCCKPVELDSARGCFAVLCSCSEPSFLHAFRHCDCSCL